MVKKIKIQTRESRLPRLLSPTTTAKSSDGSLTEVTISRMRNGKRSGTLIALLLKESKSKNFLIDASNHALLLLLLRLKKDTIEPSSTTSKKLSWASSVEKSKFKKLLSQVILFGRIVSSSHGKEPTRESLSTSS